MEKLVELIISNGWNFYASNNNSNLGKNGASDFNDEFIRETFRYYVKSTTARYLKLVIPEGHGNACPPQQFVN